MYKKTDAARRGPLSALRAFCASDSFPPVPIPPSLSEEEVAGAVLQTEMLLAQGNEKEARELLDGILELQPGNEDAISYKAIMELEMVDFTGQEKREEVLARSLPTVRELKKLPQRNLDAAIAALSHMQGFEGVQSPKVMRYAANEVIKDTPFHWCLLLRSFVLQGHLFWLQKQYDRALQSYQNAIMLLGKWEVDIPSFSSIIVNAALEGQEKCWLLMGQVMHCLDFYRSKLLLAMKPVIAPSLSSILCLRLAHVLTYASHEQMGVEPNSIFEEAVLLLLLYLHGYDNVIESNLNQTKEQIRNKLTVALYRAGRSDLVVQVFRDAVSINMQDQNLWYKLSLALASAKQYAEAFDAISQSISAFVTIPTFAMQHNAVVSSSEQVSSLSGLGFPRVTVSSADEMRANEMDPLSETQQKTKSRKFSTQPCELLPLADPFISIGQSFASKNLELIQLPYETLFRIERTALAAKLNLNYLHNTRAAVEFARHSVQLCLSISRFISKRVVDTIPVISSSPISIPPVESFASLANESFPAPLLSQSLPQQIFPESILPSLSELNPLPSGNAIHSLSFIGEPTDSFFQGIEGNDSKCVNAAKIEEVSAFGNQLRVLTVLSYHLFGAACSKFSFEVLYYTHRLQLQASAFDALQRAAHLSPRSIRVVLHLALVFADMRKISVATSLVNHVLAVDTGYVDAWHLFALLLSSNRKYQEAVDACNIGLTESPLHFELLLTKCKLLAALDLYPEAYQCYLALAEIHFDADRFFQLPYSKKDELGRVTLCNRPSFIVPDRNLFVQNLDKRESLHKMADPNSKCIQILIHLAEAYITSEDTSLLQDALSCLRTARYFVSNESPWLCELHYALACIAERAHNYESANAHYQTALAVDASHLDSLIRLGVLEGKSGNLVLAHGMLTSALRQDSSSHEAWYQLGLILKQQNKDEEASDAFLTCLELEKTAPIRSFACISREIL